MATKSVSTKSKPVLKYRKKASCEAARLPFVGKGWWDVPATGGYEGGCEMGRYAAVAYLKMLKKLDSTGGGFLQHVVLSMLERSTDAKPNDSFRGQVVGFFAELDKSLHMSARLDRGLDEYSESDLAAAMTRAVNLDHAAWYAAIQTIWDINGTTRIIPFEAYRRTETTSGEAAA